MVVWDTYSYFGISIWIITTHEDNNPAFGNRTITVHALFPGIYIYKLTLEK